MTRECQSCGSIQCDGIECYLESSPDAVEFARNTKLIREKYGAEQFTQCDPDPLLKRRA